MFGLPFTMLEYNTRCFIGGGLLSKTKSITLRYITASALFDGHDATINLVRRWLQSKGVEVIHLGHNRSVSEIANAAIDEDVDAIAITSYQGGHNEYLLFLAQELKRKSNKKIAIFAGGGGVISKNDAVHLEKNGITKIYLADSGTRGGVEGLVEDMIERTKRLVNQSKNKTVSMKQVLPSLLSELQNTTLKNDRIKKSKNKLKTNSVVTKSKVVGFTGPGGAGKSTLIDEWVLRFLKYTKNKRVAILCVDPSRQATGGALLGDRLRFNCTLDSRVFLYSVATRCMDRSLAKHCSDMLKIMKDYGYDLVIIETAGTGQSDCSITKMCDYSVYVMTSEFGAGTQLEKISMLDYADMVVLNKSDKAGSMDALNEVKKVIARSKVTLKNNAHHNRVMLCCAHHHNDAGVNKMYHCVMSDLKWEESLEDHTLLDKRDKSSVLKRTSTVLSDVCDSLEAYYKEGEAMSRHYKKNKKNKQQTWCIDSIKKYKSYFKHQACIRTQSGLNIPKIALPEYKDSDSILQYMRKENIPGEFPYTNGIHALKRKEERPTRMFAGEGSPEQTNTRFHFLCEDQKSNRLSTAFDSVTLYGCDPKISPDIYGKIGNAGVSVCSLDDMKRLYSGFDLCSDSTSVSMTINGPATILLAFFFNVAVDAAIERQHKKEKRWHATSKKIATWFKNKNRNQPVYRSSLPENHDGSGLGFLGLSSREIVGIEEYEAMQKKVLPLLRGTLQADILKEEQAQNTCLYSRDFSLELMADIQCYFVKNKIKQFYSVSVSGYHIAEAGATPVTELAFTLANGFTLLELFLSKGLTVDQCASNFSFFFSNGLDPEYSVIGRVARRIWAIALKVHYKANEKSQKLKYHIQTSGRSLHSKDCAFNDIRTTLEALYATFDNCNSLHTNAFDEAISTPTEDSVRRALAIQMIINEEYGLTQCENPFQGSYLMSWLTDKVEKAVLEEFKAIQFRGGVLEAMDYHYQRNKIQEEAMQSEMAKSNGKMKIIGVNTFINPKGEVNSEKRVRSSTKIKKEQVKQVRELKKHWHSEALDSLGKLREAYYKNQNTFGPIMDAAKYCTLQQISECLADIGGLYRRSA